jgi:hypothetical protein
MIAKRVVRLLLVFALVVATIAPTSESGTLRGVVKDSWQGAPVGGAYLVVHREGGIPEPPDVRLRVADDGTYTVTLKPGVYTIFIAASGFAPICAEVEIESGKTEIFSPRMEISRFLK